MRAGKLSMLRVQSSAVGLCAMRRTKGKRLSPGSVGIRNDSCRLPDGVIKWVSSKPASIGVLQQRCAIRNNGRKGLGPSRPHTTNLLVPDARALIARCGRCLERPYMWALRRRTWGPEERQGDRQRGNRRRNSLFMAIHFFRLAPTNFGSSALVKST